MTKIKAWNARHVDNMGCSIAKPASIFMGNAEIDYFKLKLISHDLFRGSLGIRQGDLKNRKTRQFAPKGMADKIILIESPVSKPNYQRYRT